MISKETRKILDKGREQFNDVLVPGNKFRVKEYQFGGAEPNTLIHLRGIVDGQLIFKWWGVHKRRWFYCVEPKYIFEWYLADGKMVKVK